VPCAHALATSPRRTGWAGREVCPEWCAACRCLSAHQHAWDRHGRPHTSSCCDEDAQRPGQPGRLRAVHRVVQVKPTQAGDGSRCGRADVLDDAEDLGHDVATAGNLSGHPSGLVARQGFPCGHPRGGRLGSHSAIAA
jgi:hypothetical protein